MNVDLEVVQVMSEAPVLSSQEPNAFPDDPVLANCIPRSCGMEENSMNTIDPNQIFQAVVNQTDIDTDNVILATVAKVAEDVVEQTAIITNDIVPVLFATVAKVAEDTIINQSIEKQTLAEIIKQFPVYHAGGAADNTHVIKRSINSLDVLINELQNNDSICKGRSPGFETIGSNHFWVLKSQLSTSYEVLPSVNLGQSTLPLPDADIAAQYLLKVKNTWIERLQWVNCLEKNSFCSCISKWGHHNGDILSILSNQAFEQAMIREASDCVTARMEKPGYKKGEVWDQLYLPNSCPTPSDLSYTYIPNISIQILDGRNEYIHKFVSYALRAKSSIEICTCYLFAHDPAQRYLFLYLFPFLAQRGIKVKLLCDMMPIESLALRGALQVDSQFIQKKSTSRGSVSPLSFLECLPSNAPKCTDTSTLSGGSSLDYLQQILDIASSMPNDAFQFRWWCARDAEDKYRIKNHVKCILIDREISFIGGSNIFPTPESGNYDLDLLVAGDLTKNIGNTFDYIWEMMDAATYPSHLSDNYYPNRNTTKDGSLLTSDVNWTDPSANATYLRSEPSSSGEDIILRNVLGAIKTAEKSIMMCMGHSNKPAMLAVALGEAVKRGVTVKILVNSLYSCDIRVNQRDLFLSLRDLLTIAPGVEVWSTAMPSRRNSRALHDEKKIECDVDEEVAPPFLHAKYTVIDSCWSAVGSWNVWTRSAFYEIEHELFIHSEPVAKRLEEKFNRDINDTASLISSPEMCNAGGNWCPSGCDLCLPFGPFYEQV